MFVYNRIHRSPREDGQGKFDLSLEASPETLEDALRDEDLLDDTEDTREEEAEEEEEETSSDETAEDSAEGDGEEEEEDLPLAVQVKQLQEQNQRLMEMIQEGQKKPEETQQMEPEVFIDESIFDEDGQVDAGKLNESYNKMLNRALEAFTQKLPNLLSPMVDQRLEVREAAKNFYTRNPQWEKNRDFVAMRLTKMASDNPDLSLQQLFTKLEKGLNDEFGVGNARQKKRVHTAQPQTTPRKPSGGPKEKRNKTAHKQIMDLLD